MTSTDMTIRPGCRLQYASDSAINTIVVYLKAGHEAAGNTLKDPDAFSA